jgi:hypothetical protein
MKRLKQLPTQDASAWPLQGNGLGGFFLFVLFLQYWALTQALHLPGKATPLESHH